MDSGMECTPSNFVDDIKLYGPPDTLKRRDATQRDLGLRDRPKSTS